MIAAPSRWSARCCTGSMPSARMTYPARPVAAAPRPAAADDPRLAVDLLGRRFPNPVGLAAGFDKGARVPDAMLGLGFGFVEVGGVVPQPQPGKPQPRRSASPPPTGP